MDRKVCGATDSSVGGHEDHWPLCNLPYRHPGAHLFVPVGDRSKFDMDMTRKAAEEAINRSAAAQEVIKGGGVRNPTNTDYSQLSHVALRLIAETTVEGDAKYGPGNWRKGIPVSNLLSHAIEHILKLQNGDITENHLGHALWNLEKAAHFIETRLDLIDILPLRKALGLDLEHGVPGCKGLMPSINVETGKIRYLNCVKPEGHKTPCSPWQPLDEPDKAR